MKKNNVPLTWLGKTGIKTSRLVLGTMGFGNEADEVTSRAIFEQCRDAGINHIDTADVYIEGKSEQIVGRLLKDCREQFLLATKAYFPTGAGPNQRGTSRANLRRSVEASLRRLQTDRIDLFYLHRFDDRTDLEETLRGVEDLVRAGMIVYPAVSNFSAWQTVKALGLAQRLGSHPVVAVQPMYNLFKRVAEVEMLPMALSENLAIFPYSPLAGGLLSGKYRQKGATGRMQSNKMYQNRYNSPEIPDVVEKFCGIADELQVHPASLAVAWAMRHPGVTAPIIAGRNTEQVALSLAACAITLSDEDYARISALTPTPPPATDRNEETTAHNFGSR